MAHRQLNILILENNEPAIDSLLEIIEKQGSAFRVFLWSVNKEYAFNCSSRFTNCIVVETLLELEVLINETDSLYICGSHQNETYAYLLYVLANVQVKKKIGVYRMPVDNVGQVNFIKELAQLKSAEIVFVSPYRFNTYLNTALKNTGPASSIELIIPYCVYEGGVVFAEILEGLNIDGGKVELLDYKQEIQRKTLQLKLAGVATRIIVEGNSPGADILLKHYHSGELNSTTTISEPDEIANMNLCYNRKVIDFFMEKVDRNECNQLFYDNLKMIEWFSSIVSNSKGFN